VYIRIDRLLFKSDAREDETRQVAWIRQYREFKCECFNSQE